jgi:hypothetical protein
MAPSLRPLERRPQPPQRASKERRSIIFESRSRQELTGSKFGMKIWTRIGGNCLGLLQTKTMSNINEEKQVLSNINGETQSK